MHISPDENLLDLSPAFSDESFLQIATTSSSNRSHTVAKEALSNLWGIGLNAAAQTLQVTTQKGIRNAVHPIVRRFATKQARLRYNQLGSRHGRFYSDTFFSDCKSTRNNTMAQLFVNDIKFMRIIPMKRKSEAANALIELIQDIGIPASLHCDGAMELQYGKWKEICQEYGIRQSSTEPYSPWQNRAEINIREAKKSIRRLMQRSKTPLPLWDYCATYVAEIISLTSNDIYALHGRTPYEVVTGNTPDITEYVEFRWYEPIYYYDEANFPSPKLHLARWLGVAHRVGQALCYWMITKSGKVIARTTIRALTKDELATEAVQMDLANFDNLVLDYFKNNIFPLEETVSDFLFAQDEVILPFDEEGTMPEDDDTPDTEAYDQYITAKVMLPRGDVLEKAIVTSRKRDANGALIGRANANPLLDTRVYEVQFSDGASSEYSANVIAENIFATVDDDGYECVLLDEIIDHRCDPAIAITIDDSWITGFNGNRSRRRTSKGWELCVSWKDGSTSWLPLKDLRSSNPLQVADYAIAHNLQDEPAFSWWIGDIQKQRKRIMCAIGNRYLKRTHKFGIQVPKSVDEALQIDRESNTTLWYEAIQKEMKNNAIAFEFLEPHAAVPLGYKKITLHMIFDVKMDFTRKARLVAGGHLTDPPASITYSSVVSRDSVRIMFLIAALNDLQVLAADIGNAYLNAPNRERVYAIAGKEFGSRAGERVIIVRALYGLKSAGAAWRSHLASSLLTLGYKSCLADPDVWLREATKNDGTPYYEYLIVYVDDILAFSLVPQETMKAISELYRLKDNSVTKPERYLGADVVQFYLPGDSSKPRWGLSSTQYIAEAIRNVEHELSKIGKALSNTISTPISSGYRPELDVSPLLSPEQANYFQNLIGVLRWIIELGRLDIHVHVSMLSTFLAAPRQGHLNEVLHIFAYLKRYKKSTMVFDDTLPNLDESIFQQNADWSDFYRDATEKIPPNAPEPRGHHVNMYCFCDSDHAGDRVTRRSQTGIILFLNRSPITWFSKKQNTVETSTFGAEFVALRIAVELIESLRYKLRMMGIPIAGPCSILCDNESVVKNSSIPESVLKRKHNAIAYHRVREASASGMVRIGHIHSSHNLADMLTKPLSRNKIHDFCEQILF
jgi:hypothetical protein